MQAVVRRLVAPATGLLVLALSASVAGAVVGQPKPQLSIEASRQPEGARILFKGKNWPAKSRIKITATRAPGSTKPQDFGMFDADDKGEFQVRKVAACSTNNMEDAQNEPVTFTAADSATGVKATQRVEGGAWVCQ